MSAALRALLRGVIDYAGLFPPAQLPLDQAIRNYARYRTEPESWMLGRFIIPAAWLAELEPYHEALFRQGPPFSFSALTRSTSDFAGDMKAIAAFQYGHDESVAVEILEVRLTEEILRELPIKLSALLEIGSTRILIDGLKLRPLTPFHEIEIKDDWREIWSALITGVAIQRKNGQPGGFKLRCGGLEASAFPSPDQVAFVIAACRDARVPLKLTAGLHHPIRHFNASVQAKMHGFLNVFVAGVLAHARRLSEDQVRQIIEDEDAGHFLFDDDGLRWKDLHATIDEIVTARRELVTSFGSCSFDEPRDDLRALGLLT